MALKSLVWITVLGTHMDQCSASVGARRQRNFLLLLSSSFIAFMKEGKKKRIRLVGRGILGCRHQRACCSGNLPEDLDPSRSVFQVHLQDSRIQDNCPQMPRLEKIVSFSPSSSASPRIFKRKDLWRSIYRQILTSFGLALIRFHAAKTCEEES